VAKPSAEIDAGALQPADHFAKDAFLPGEVLSLLDIGVGCTVA